MKVSMIIPCYKSEMTIDRVTKKIIKVFEDNGYEYEMILVNDCSPDHTWDSICGLCEKIEHIIGIDLAKNVGQHTAIMAGLRMSTGDIIMSSDDDGQTPIENIPLLIDKLIKNDYDVVCAKYTSFERKSLGRRLGTLFYKLVLKIMLDQPKGVEIRVFMAARRFIIDEICQYDQPYTSLNGLILRATHNIGNVEMEQHARDAGISGYSFRKLVRAWMNGFTAFSIVPLRIASLLGGGIATSGFIGAIIIVVRKLSHPTIQVGWSSLLTVILIMSGLILLVLGIIGEYVGRMYMCINHTPQYIIKNIKR